MHLHFHIFTFQTRSISNYIIWLNKSEMSMLYKYEILSTQAGVYNNARLYKGGSKSSVTWSNISKDTHTISVDRYIPSSSFPDF